MNGQQTHKTTSNTFLGKYKLQIKGDIILDLKSKK